MEKNIWKPFQILFGLKISQQIEEILCDKNQVFNRKILKIILHLFRNETNEESLISKFQETSPQIWNCLIKNLGTEEATKKKLIKIGSQIREHRLKNKKRNEMNQSIEIQNKNTHLLKDDIKKSRVSINKEKPHQHQLNQLNQHQHQLNQNQLNQNHQNQNNQNQK
ncbi:hypothetical protein M0811_00421 [Anaeramoeba ignava]|uniref:Uncharacterized protein n=1 Tax=Anaeramoeba ignava TaxID=1746090 RepID=A0A9Q0LQY6_ANAIG|nr:hypothetical protein M0811_00421 [Anaeramoeba ignava]